MTQEDTLETKILKVCERYLLSDTRILAVFLLGSAARDALKPESDIDIGVMCEFGEAIGQLELAENAANLSYELQRSVDLGLISSSNLVYACEALLTGKVLADKNPDRTALQRAALLGMYLQFNRDRQEVIDAYRA
jgi:predicted nucleotidyltransferase